MATNFYNKLSILTFFAPFFSFRQLVSRRVSISSSLFLSKPSKWRNLYLIKLNEFACQPFPMQPNSSKNIAFQRWNQTLLIIQKKLKHDFDYNKNVLIWFLKKHEITIQLHFFKSLFIPLQDSEYLNIYFSDLVCHFSM